MTCHGAGRLIKSGAIKHSYPFCWRSDTPLIYRAVPSWFVKVESLRDKLLANNAKVCFCARLVCHDGTPLTAGCAYVIAPSFSHREQLYSRPRALMLQLLASPA